MQAGGLGTSCRLLHNACRGVGVGGAMKKGVEDWQDMWGMESYAMVQCKAHASYLWCRACYTPAQTHSYVRAEALEP